MKNKFFRLAPAIAALAVFVILCFAITDVDAEETYRSNNLTNVFSLNCLLPNLGENAERNLDAEGVTLTVDTGEYNDSPFYYGPKEYKLLGDNRIGILDSESNRLLIYDIETNTLENIISFPGCEYAMRFTYHNGLYYVYDVGNGAIMKVLEIDENSNVLRTIPAPDLGSVEDYEIQDEYYLAKAALFSAELEVYDGKVVLMSGRSGDWVFDDYFLEGDKFVACDPIYTHVLEKDGWSTFTYGDLSWRVYLPEFMIDILGVDEQGNLYLYCVGCLLDSEGTLYGDSCILVYDRNSELVKGGNVDLDEYSIIPSHTAKLADNYDVYVLAGTTASIDLMKVTLTEDYTIPNRTNGSTTITVLNDQDAEEERITFSPSYTRAQANTRAQSFVNFTYVLSEKNTHAWNDCILHSSITPSAAGTTMTGAPYARER